MYDVVVLGTGPAGLQAAIHAARPKVSVLVMGREHKSSLFRAHVENYCCMTGIFGEELLQQGVRQALDSGAHFFTDKQQLTNIKGIYAAGDICGPPWQMAKAVGEGCVAGLAASKYTKTMKRQSTEG